MRDAPIKCCPFCGGHEVEISRTNPNACWVECANDRCGAQTHTHRTRKGAIENWNKRTSDNDASSIVYDMENEFKFQKRGAK